MTDRFVASNFQSSRKKDNLERLTEIFEMSFRKFSVLFDFTTTTEVLARSLAKFCGR